MVISLLHPCENTFVFSLAMAELIMIRTHTSSKTLSTHQPGCASILDKTGFRVISTIKGDYSGNCGHPFIMRVARALLDPAHMSGRYVSWDTEKGEVEIMFTFTISWCRIL